MFTEATYILDTRMHICMAHMCSADASCVAHFITYTYMQVHAYTHTHTYMHAQASVQKGVKKWKARCDNNASTVSIWIAPIHAHTHANTHA